MMLSNICRALENDYKHLRIYKRLGFNVVSEVTSG